MTGLARPLTDVWPHLPHPRRRAILRELEWERAAVRRETAEYRAARHRPERFGGSVRAMAQRILDRMPAEPPELVQRRVQALEEMPAVPQSLLREKGRRPR